MNIFKSAFADDISAMLDYRDALGHSKYNYEKLLFRFDNYCIEYFPDEQVLTHEIVVSWLEYEEKNIDIKATAIRMLGKYMVAIGKDAYVLYDKYCGKNPTSKPYILTDEELKTLLAEPNPHTKKGLRDSFIMLLMYDTAPRISGIVNLSICDVVLSKNPIVTLHEKGSKINTVPIRAQTVEHFSNYINAYHPDESIYSKKPLFYTLRNEEKHRLDDSTIRKFMKKSDASLSAWHGFNACFPMAWAFTA